MGRILSALCAFLLAACQTAEPQKTPDPVASAPLPRPPAAHKLTVAPEDLDEKLSVAQALLRQARYRAIH